MTLNIYRKITIVIAFLSTVTATGLASISNIALASIDYSDTAVEEVFKVLVIIAAVKGHCGQEVTITLADKSQTFELCEGDERPLEEQRADPIISKGREFEFPKGQFAVGESFDVCVEDPGGYSDYKTLTNSPANKPE